jgi:hypothetical protein
VFALKLSIPVTWSGSLIANGSGTFVTWARVQLTQSGTSLTGNVRACGQTVPDFSSTVGETYEMSYPTSIFDRTPALPSTATSGTLGGTAPGSSFALARSAWLMGVTMADPINGAWPNATATANMAQDGDADGKLGVTSIYRTGGGYDLPPTNMFATSRAMRGYLAARIVFTLGGTMTSCTQASGAATAQDVDYHTIGCRLSGDNNDCGSGDTSHLDSHGPNYVTSASSYTLLKLANTAVCSDVRAALP